MKRDTDTVDLFAGCGGASSGAALVGRKPFGIEWNKDAVATHQAAGHPCEHADVRDLAPQDFVPRRKRWHFHASPPCTTFSTAGRKAGRSHVDELSLAVKRVLHGESHGLADPDETTLLTLEPARWLSVVRPTTITFEQVRSVLPVWEAYADALGGLGYSTWTGYLDAEQFGVPQTRRRAWLIARLGGTEVTPPPPTHSRFHSRSPERLDDDVLSWVSMATALGISPETVSGFPRRADNADVIAIDGVDYRARDLREARYPAQTLTEKARSWVALAPAGVTCPARPRLIDQPAHTITGAGNAYLLSSVDQATGRGGGTDGKANGATKITVEQAAALQSFPADYPWQGKRTSQFRQIGNAVPPLVMAAVMRHLDGAA